MAAHVLVILSFVILTFAILKILFSTILFSCNHVFSIRVENSVDSDQIALLEAGRS